MARPTPTPTNLKTLKGNPGKRALPKHEPKPEALTDQPPGLSKLAAEHWDQVAKELAAANVLTRMDASALRLYCEAFARWRDANRAIDEEGMIISAPSGYPVQNPHLSISNKAHDQMVKLLCEFGMTPASRTKVQTVQEEKHDPLADFMARKKA